MSLSFRKSSQSSKKVSELQDTIIKNGAVLFSALEEAVAQYDANSKISSFNPAVLFSGHNKGKTRSAFLNYHISALKTVDLMHPPHLAVLLCISYILMCSSSHRLKQFFVEKARVDSIFSAEIIESTETDRLTDEKLLKRLLNRAITRMSQDYPTKHIDLDILGMYGQLESEYKTFDPSVMSSIMTNIENNSHHVNRT
ncbi:MAG: hypothetical protein LRY43_03810 [Gammaproteobacteria bacterium]|nr:hypothetical protein [Gammaproteobacteria bacterium]